MLAHVIAFSIRNRLFVVFGAVVLMLFGGWQTSQLPVDVFPDLNRPTVTLLTEAPGLAPEEVETLVTFPIETTLNGATGVQRVRSNSGVGLSIVFVEFDWGTDILQARQLVSEKLNLVQEQLPEGITPQMGPISSIMGEIMLIGVQSKARPPMEVRNFADWVIRPRLLTVPGVSQVIPIGGGRMQIQVKVDPARLKALGLSMEEVSRAVENANKNTTGGFLEQRGQEWLVRNIGRIDRIQDLANSVVAYRNNAPVLLQQVATVEQDVQVKRGDASVNASPAVILSIQKQPGADTVELTRRIHATIDDLKRTLPADIVVNDRLFLQASFIQSAIRNVIDAMEEAAVLVSIVLILFLLNLRTTFISLLALPVSFIVAGLAFKMMGISINTMTLGGLAVAIGELVDDAIVDVENIHRRLKENRLLQSPANPLRVIYRASNEVRSSIVYATLMMCVVFIPLFQMSGLEGRMFRPLGIAYIIAILSSLVVSLTLTPALSAYLLPKAGRLMRRSPERDSPLVRVLKWIDLIQLRFSLAFPNLVMFTFYGLTAICVWIFLHFGREFLPAFNEGTMTVTMIAQPGTSLEESNRLGHQAERLVMEVPEVTAVGRRTGRAELDEHAEGVYTSELEIDLKAGRPREAIFADVREKLSGIRGVALNIGQPIAHRLDHMLSGVNAQIAVKIFGDDLEVLRAQAEQTRAVMAKIPGVVDLSVEKQVPIPQLRIRLLREEAKKYGVMVGDLARTLESALYGERVSEIIEGQRRYDLVVKFTEGARRDAEALQNLLVDTPTGVKVPLKAVADVLESVGPNTINREDVQRRIVVQANVADRDLGTVVEEVQKAVTRNVGEHLPPGYFISYEGQFEAQQKATRTIALLSLVSLAVMYLLLYNLFRVHRVVWAVLFNVPLAMIGAVLAVAFTNQTFSIASLMGFITLTGVSLRNGIMLVEHYIYLMREEGLPFSKETIIRGSLERLVPVLMTASTSLLAMIPFVFSDRGAPGKEILEPMAMVIFAGTLSSTLLDLMYTPAFFWRWCGPVVPKLIRRRDESWEEESAPAGEPQVVGAAQG